jgi:TolA-binding protein
MKRPRKYVAILCILLVWMAGLSGCGDSPKKLVHQAGQKFDAGDYLGALALYEQVVENFPKNQVADDALYWMGIINHLYLKDDVKGLQAFERVAKDYPASPFAIDAQRYTAAILERLQKTRQAIEAYEHLSEISPDPKVAQESHYKIGELYFEAGDLDQARNEWDAQLKKYPDGMLTDRILYGIASTYFIQGQCEEALNFLERLIQNYPQSEVSTDARFRVASCLEEEGRIQEALARFKEMVDSYPNRPVVEMKIKALSEQLNKL